MRKRECENGGREQRGSKANETEKEAERGRQEEGRGQDRKEKDARQTAAGRGKRRRHSAATRTPCSSLELQNKHLSGMEHPVD